MTNEALSQAYGPLTKPDTNNATYIPWFTVQESQYRKDGWTNLREHYQRLDEYNAGIRNGDRTNGGYWTYRDNRDVMQALSSQLELNDHQYAVAVRWFHALDLGDTGIRKEHIAFVICSIIVHQDEQSIRKCHYNCNDIDETFVRMRERLGLRNKQFKTLYERFIGEWDDDLLLPTTPQFDARDMDGAKFCDPDWQPNASDIAVSG